MKSGKNIRTKLLPSLFCLLGLLLVACGGSTTPQTTGKAPDNKQIYIAPLGGVSDVKTFDPGLSTDLTSITAIDMVFTGLVQLNDKLEVIDQLAASHSVADDGVTWTFKLRDNLKFSDGTPLTADDVTYSIDRALQPSLKSITAPIYLGLIKDADKLNKGKVKTLIGTSLMAPDPKTVVIIAGLKAAYFLQSLTYSSSYIIEKSMIEKYGNDKFADHLAEGIGGAGPFMVSKYTHGKEIVFVPNPNYYGKKPQLKKVVMPFYKTADTVYKAYQVGQVHVAGVPSAQLADAKALPNKQYKEVPQLSIFYYAMNYLIKPFDNIKIRQAFSLALDKDAIAHNVYKDTVIATNHIVPEGQPGYNPNLVGPAGVKDTKGDAAKAKELFTQGLQEEGWTSVSQMPPITLTVSTGGTADARNEFAAAQQMWKNNLGVDVKIVDVDFNVLLDDIPAATNNPKGLMFWAIAWIADYPDPQDWLTLQFDKGVPNNNNNYGQNSASNASTQQGIQQIMEQADVNPNNADRMQQYMKAEQQLVDDVAWLPRWQAKTTLVRKPCVVGVIDNASLLTPPDDWADVYISSDNTCADVAAYQ